MLGSDFYYLCLKTFQEDLSQIELGIIHKGKNLQDITANISFSGDLDRIIREISAVSDIHFNQIAQNWSLNPYELAAATVQITSKFITFLDYLHLEPENNPQLCSELLDDLIQSLLSLSIFHPLYLQVVQIKATYSNLFSFNGSMQKSNVNIQTSLNTLKNEIYRIFNDFKHYLHIT
jgi:hypothetical protein